MKNRIILFSLMLGAMFSANAQVTIIDSIFTGGIYRNYRLYVPAAYSEDTPAPLVFNLHGYTSDAFGQSVYANFNPIADTAGFLTVIPNGTLDIFGKRYWNCFIAPGTGVDDVAFLSALIDSLDAEYNIDLNREYFTGMSNGGFMSHTLACELSNRIAAIASVAGSIDEDRMPFCDPQHNTPVMQIHGNADGTVPYDGAFGFLPVDSVVSYWVKQNHCNEAPTFTAIPDLVPSDLCTAEHYVYNACYKDINVELFKIIDGGHTWPGTAVTFLGVTNLDINACREIWRFFSQYRLDELTGIETNPLLKNDINIYPNPFTENIYLNSEKGLIDSWMLYDVMGNLVAEDDVEGDNLITITGGDLQAGLYYLYVNGEVGMQVVKIQ
ncbi:MAG: T9SS type A sorting domain-containing protein [Bacteroidetes bacterium]|nr:T9SS type A sorting domain-containing protein [Bacteroidota bacterium]